MFSFTLCALLVVGALCGSVFESPRCSFGGEICKLSSFLADPQRQLTKQRFCLHLEEAFRDTRDTLNVVLLIDDNEGIYARKIFYECSVGAWMLLIDSIIDGRIYLRNTINFMSNFTVSAGIYDVRTAIMSLILSMERFGRNVSRVLVHIPPTDLLPTTILHTHNSEDAFSSNYSSIISSIFLRGQFGEIDIVAKEYRPTSIYEASYRAKDQERFSLDCSFPHLSSFARNDRRSFVEILTQCASELLCGLSKAKSDYVNKALASMDLIIKNSDSYSNLISISYILKIFNSQIAKISVSGRERLNILYSIKKSMMQQFPLMASNTMSAGVMYLYLKTIENIDIIGSFNSIDLQELKFLINMKVFEGMILNGNTMKTEDIESLRRQSENLNSGITLESPSV